MSRNKEEDSDNKITMTKEKFYLVLGSTIFLSIVTYGVITQMLERLF
ncbi:hypothetical protein [Jeotgalibacillus proteolyticus]